MAQKTIVIVSTLDTKGSEEAFLKALIEETGYRVILLDTNTGGEPSLPPDITAKEVARKLNKSKGPVTFLIPLKDWSSLDQEGMPLYDPGSDKAFVRELKTCLNPKIPIDELDLHLNTHEFAQEAVNRSLQLYEKFKNKCHNYC